MSNSFYHKDLTEAQWNRIKFLFEKRERVGRPSLNPRSVFNDLMWILKSGGCWRDLNWNSIYHKFRRWCSLGLFERLMKIINADAQKTTFLELDSTFCKVHQSACSGRKDQAIGVSRGGKNTKVHMLINERMQVLNVILTGGHVHDSEKAIDLLKGIKLTGKKNSRGQSIQLASKFAFSSLSTEPLLSSRTRSITGLSMILTQNCTNNAI